jgi:hypothetical protein
LALGAGWSGARRLYRRRPGKRRMLRIFALLGGRDLLAGALTPAMSASARPAEPDPVRRRNLYGATMVVMLDPDDDKIAALATGVASLAVDVTGLDTRVGALEVKVDGLGAKMDECFEQVDKRFERVEGELREQRWEMKAGFVKVEGEMKAGFEKITGEMKADLRQTLFWIAGTAVLIICALIGVSQL